MIIDTFREQSGETNRIIDFYESLKKIHGLKVESMRSESWMDDPDGNDFGPEDETQDNETWMDDLDEAA